MMAPNETGTFDEPLMRAQILAFLDVYCRDLTLRDARELYVDAFSDGGAGVGAARLNPS